MISDDATALTCLMIISSLHPFHIYPIPAIRDTHKIIYKIYSDMPAHQAVNQNLKLTDISTLWRN